MDLLFAGMGGFYVNGVVRYLQKQVSIFLKNEIEWGVNIQTALRKLDAALLPIQAVLREAEKRELIVDQNPELGEWLWKIRDAVEEAEDVLDEMAYDMLERQILERDAKEKDKVLLNNFFKVNGCSTPLIKHSIVKLGKRALNMDFTLDKLNVAVEKLQLVKENIDVLNFILSKSPPIWGGNTNGTPNNWETRSGFNKDEVIGRDKEKKRVLKFLTEVGGDEQEFDKLSVLTISGLGGLGKTTLAQSVFKDEKLSFQVKMWVCVSNNNVGMEVIMQKAIASATGMPPEMDTMTNLQIKLENIVKSKKCLLVLDDVWHDQSNQNHFQWRNFIDVISDHSERGSKLLITSRTESIAEIILPSLRIKKESLALEFLEAEESLSLLYRHAFFEVHPNKQAVLKPVANKIAKKCGGWPLALKIVGGLLNTKLEYKCWSSILKNNINLAVSTDDIKNVLKLSYQYLPSNLRYCFRICSLFPQDWEFRRDALVTLWIGLGCIDQKRYEDKQLLDIGREYLNILVRRSFLIYCNERDLYSMHDLLYDLAQDVSTGECLRVEGSKLVSLPETLRHLFVVDQLNTNLMKEISCLKRLRTLSLNYKYGSFSPHDFHDYGNLNDFVKELKSLHALFVGIRTMPSLTVFEHLKHLRLFHMQTGLLNRPLTPLYKLYHLHDLQLDEFGVPSERRGARGSFKCDGIGNLVKLRHLVLPGKIFDKVKQLRYLTELHDVRLHLKKGKAFKFSDLKDLNNLRHLTILVECETTSSTDAEEVNLDKKGNLERLSLSFCLNHSDEEVSNCLVPPKNSRIMELEVSNYNGVRAPRWMTIDYLPCLTHIQLRECRSLEHLPSLGQLPSLKFLSLQEIAGVRQSGIDFFGVDGIPGFPSLESLQISKMENWEEWTGADRTTWFPSLHYLYIDNCRQLTTLPSLPLSLKELHLDSVGLVALPSWQGQDIDGNVASTSHRNSATQLLLSKGINLARLVIHGCKSLTQFKVDSVALAALPRSNTPLLESLQINNCQGLVNFQLFLSMCVHLEKLRICNCQSLTELPRIPLRLKELNLVSVELISALPAWQEANENERRPSLTHLNVVDCPTLASLPDELPSSLTTLHIGSCSMLTSLPDNLPSLLKSLTIESCPQLELLPNIPLSLEQLVIVDCPILMEQYQRDEGPRWRSIAHIPRVVIL